MTASTAEQSQVTQTTEDASVDAPAFPLSPDSPFPDGYDIGAARDALVDLLAAAHVERSEPRIELREQEEALRHGADAVVPNHEAGRIVEVGQLTDAEPDTMTLHTQDAFRMFTGRQADTEGKVVAIAGGRRFAAVLKSIWYLSGNDNPYADWILIRMYDGLTAVRMRLAHATQERQDAIDLLKRKGLSFSVMASRSPKSVELGFRSPYGYATAEAIVEFDYTVRMIKTLIHKDRLSDGEGRAAIRELGRSMRALFLQPIRWERCLLREELRTLSRSDFLPGADEAAQKRVQAAVALFGELPRAVFTGAEAPRHTRRRVKLTEAELRLLEQASLRAEADAEQSDTGLL